VDLYGYSKWLATHLDYKFIPISLRSFQHGWIWWNHEDMPIQKGFGLDPNVNDFWGCLVQDKEIESFLLKQGIYAKSCGLPFLNFYNHFKNKEKSKDKNNENILYIPMHSNPWNDFSKDILLNAENFKFENKRLSILLSWSDRNLANQLSNFYSKIEIGAGALEDESFYRLANVFESYEYMITDFIGSHICYAIACGMKVGINARLFKPFYQGKHAALTYDVQKMKESEYFENMCEINTLEYMEKKYPGIVIDGGLPTYSTLPEISICSPQEVATQLGWNLTYESQYPSYSKLIA
jgi:hypothetical protein